MRSPHWHYKLHVLSESIFSVFYTRSPWSCTWFPTTWIDMMGFLPKYFSIGRFRALLIRTQQLQHRNIQSCSLLQNYCFCLEIEIIIFSIVLLQKLFSVVPYHFPPLLPFERTIILSFLEDTCLDLTLAWERYL